MERESIGHPSRRRLRAAFARSDCVLLFLLLAVAGCAVDDRGMVKTSRFESATGVAISLDVWGAHLITSPVDAGLTVGHSHKTYFYSKPGSNAAAEVIGPAANSIDLDGDAVARAIVHPASRPSGKEKLGPPFAYMDRSGGLSLRFNRDEVGLGAGLRTRDALVVPRDFCGLLIVDWDEASPSHSHVHIQETRH